MILFVGEATNRAGDGRWLHIYLLARALGQGPAYRKAPRAWLRATLKGPWSWLARKLVRSQQVNLFDEWPGSDGRGSRFPIREAYGRAALLVLSIDKDLPFDGSRVGLATSIVMVGKRVAKALGSERYPFYEEHALVHCGRRTWTFPHPSGVSHYWNAPGAAERALAELLILADDG